MLTTIEKILEKSVYLQIMNLIKDNIILTEFQLDFIKNYSYEKALNSMLHGWLEALSRDQIVFIILLDLKLVFETVDTSKLPKYL